METLVPILWTCLTAGLIIGITLGIAWIIGFIR